MCSVQSDACLAALTAYPSSQLVLTLTNSVLIELDEKRPFLLFIASLQTGFSGKEVRKRSESFASLQKTLLCLKN